jgi:[NiFe] hydrogenase diaphorase moiety large subunit
MKQDLQGWVEQYGGDRTALIPALQEIQKKYRHISAYAMQALADLLDIHPVEVYGVVSFYSFLNSEPQGKFVIRLCRTISCDMQGKDRIARQLENDLGIEFGQTTPDGRFTLEWTNCLGMCDQGPAMLINDQVFTRVTADQVHDLIEECRKQYGPHAAQGKEACKT